MSTQLPKRLRQNCTRAERLLWTSLRDRRLNGRKWRRQHRIGSYVVDFYCPELNLVVELDGGVHGLKLWRDRRRQEFLAAQGLTVIRFRNGEVLRNKEGVLQRLWEITFDPSAP